MINEYLVNLSRVSKIDSQFLEKTTDYFTHYMSEVEDRNLGAYDKEVSLQKKDEQLFKEFKKNIANLSQTELVDIEGIKENPVLMQNPMITWATMAVVTSMIDAVFPLTSVDSIGLYTEIKTVGLNSTAQFEIAPNSLYTVSRSTNGQRDSFVQKDFRSTRTLNPIPHDITVQVSMYRVLCGYESLGEFLVKAIKSIDTQMSLDAYKAFTSVFEALTFPKDLKVTGYTAKSLLSLCQKVQAYNGGAKPVIVGTSVALSNILPDSKAGFSMNMDVNNISIQLINNFYDYNVIVLPQVATGSNDFGLALRDDRVYVLNTTGDKIVKGAVEGATNINSNDFYDKANLVENTTLKKNWTFEVITNAIAGVLVLE